MLVYHALPPIGASGLWVGRANDPAAGKGLVRVKLATIHLRADTFYGEWNYSLLPRQGLL